MLDRVRSAWRELPSERRLAAAACLGLFASLFLPWYQETVITRGSSAGLNTLATSLTGWGAFSFVEAALLLVAAAVLVLLFVRAEGAAFHVPGGDGGVITAAGLWCCLLIVWRMFDKQGTTPHGLYTDATGVEWGIFVALVLGALLAYAGTRIRQARESEPPLPGEQATPRRPFPAPADAEQPVAAVRRRPQPFPSPPVDSPGAPDPAPVTAPTAITTPPGDSEPDDTLDTRSEFPPRPRIQPDRPRRRPRIRPEQAPTQPLRKPGE